MNAFLLSLLLWTQGIPVQPTQTGTVTGVLRTADGKPAVNERVTAIPQVEFAGEAADGATLSSLAVTDEQGRYTLENIPPGRYYIAAGRLDLQTYYPGTQAMNAGLPVQIAPGAKLEKIDFTLNSTSAGRSISAGFGNAAPAFIVPLDIRIENGGKVPLSSGGKFTAIKLTSVTGSVAVSAPLDGGISLPPGSADYRITFEGLPADYRVKTMKYGATALSDGLLKITTAAPINAGNIVTAVFSQLVARAGFGWTRSSTPDVVDRLRDRVCNSGKRSASQRQHPGQSQARHLSFRNSWHCIYRRILRVPECRSRTTRHHDSRQSARDTGTRSIRRRGYGRPEWRRSLGHCGSPSQPADSGHADSLEHTDSGCAAFSNAAGSRTRCRDRNPS